MGFGLVLVIGAVAGMACATIASLGLRALVVRLTTTAPQRKFLLRFATGFPFACLLWAATVFAVRAAINISVFHRDIGVGDYSTAPLPDGYAISFVDTDEIGTIHKLDAQNGISNVRRMQLAGPYILAASDSQAFDHFDQGRNSVDRWYFIDTRNDQWRQFNELEPLLETARALRIQVNLIPISDIYSEYLYTWFDGLAAVLLIIPPIIGAGWFVWSAFSP